MARDKVWYVGNHTTARFVFWDDDITQEPPTPDNPEGYITTPAEITLVIKTPGTAADRVVTLTGGEVKQRLGPAGTSVEGEPIGEFYYDVLGDDGPGQYIFYWQGETADGYLSGAVDGEVCRTPMEV